MILDFRLKKNKRRILHDLSDEASAKLDSYFMIRTSCSRGFTLMEIVVATTIFVLVFSAILSLFNYTLKINRRSEGLRQATQGMRSFVEYLVKEIRNGQVDYYFINGNIPSNSIRSGSPCLTPVGGVGQDTYFDKSNWLGLINNEGKQMCFYYANENGSYVQTVGQNPSVFSGRSKLMIDKTGIIAPEALNPPNFVVDNLMFVVRPQRDPYSYTPSLVKFSPVVSIYLKFIVTLPTGEKTVIYYQTSVSTSNYDIPRE